MMMMGDVDGENRTFLPGNGSRVAVRCSRQVNLHVRGLDQGLTFKPFNYCAATLCHVVSTVVGSWKDGECQVWYLGSGEFPWANQRGNGWMGGDQLILQPNPTLAQAWPRLFVKICPNGVF